MKIPTWLWAVGAYLFLRPKGGLAPTDDIPPKPAPKPPAGVGGWTPIAKHLTLQTDTRYFVRLELHGIEAAASADDIKDKLSSVGFTGVRVWMGQGPASAPDSTHGQTGPFVLGTWSGVSKVVDLPSEVVEAWVES